MRFSPFARLRLERLETRFAPASLGDAPDTSSPPPPSSLTVIDPTLSPSDPTQTNVAVTITAVGVPAPGTQNVTVTGLTASNLQPGASLAFSINGTSYVIDSYAKNNDGSVR